MCVVWIALAALLGTGCAAPETRTGASSPGRLLAPAAFAAEASGDDRVVINVHVPDEGSIPGTDLAIPFDQLGRRAAELPADRSTPLAVYCRSGSMSATASRTLAEMGYTDVVDLRGGMIAWRESGRTLLPPGS